MMKLIHDPDPILKQKAEPWDFKNHINAAVVEQEMLAIMKANKGVGLAANQVGLLRRVFVMKLADEREISCFNPWIMIGDNDLINGEEGCLSFPNLWLKVKRHNKITAAYLDNAGKQCQLLGSDSIAPTQPCRQWERFHQPRSAAPASRHRCAGERNGYDR